MPRLQRQEMRPWWFDAGPGAGGQQRGPCRARQGLPQWVTVVLQVITLGRGRGTSKALAIKVSCLHLQSFILCGKGEAELQGTRWGQEETAPHWGCHAALTRHTSVATSMLRQLNQLS